MRGQTTSLLPRGEGAHSWTSCSGNRRALLLKMAALSCSTRVQGSRLPKARRHSRRHRASSHCGGPRLLRASHLTVAAHSCSTLHPGSRRQACRKARRQCHASSCQELHRAWRLPMVAARFCSTRRPGWRRKGLLFGLRRRSPKGPRHALRRLAEVRFRSTRVRELPRMGFLFSLRHHAPPRASHR